MILSLLSLGRLKVAVYVLVYSCTYWEFVTILFILLCHENCFVKLLPCLEHYTWWYIFVGYKLIVFQLIKGIFLFKENDSL